MGNFVRRERIVHAPAERVWGLLEDVERWPETFTPHLRSVQLDGPLAVGTKGSVKTKLPLPRSEFVVTSVQPGGAWAWQGKVLWFTVDFDHRCERVPDGCRAVFDVDLNGPLAPLVRPIARLSYSHQIKRALNRLANAAESD